MTLYIVRASAIEYWRNPRFGEPRRSRAALPFGAERAARDAGFDPADLTKLDAAGVGGLSRPFHLLVPAAAARRRCADATFHVCAQRLPEGSFLRLSRDVMVSSPEIACLSEASSRRFPFFVELLYELCGFYRLPQGRGGEAIVQPPVTSANDLESFAGKARGLHGASSLKRAVRYVCDNSLSPMETDITETMLLDPRMGGFGVAKPLLNPRFAVSRKNRRVLPQSTYLPDLYWPQADISIEYESDKHHSDSRKLSEDAVRRNGIEHLGTRVVTLTWEQAKNYYEFERVALLIASALGKRYSPHWQKWEDRRIALHRMLVQNRTTEALPSDLP